MCLQAFVDPELADQQEGYRPTKRRHGGSWQRQGTKARRRLAAGDTQPTSNRTRAQTTWLLEDLVELNEIFSPKISKIYWTLLTRSQRFLLFIHLPLYVQRSICLTSSDLNGTPFFSFFFTDRLATELIPSFLSANQSSFSIINFKFINGTPRSHHTCHSTLACSRHDNNVDYAYGIIFIAACTELIKLNSLTRKYY